MTTKSNSVTWRLETRLPGRTWFLGTLITVSAALWLIGSAVMLGDLQHAYRAHDIAMRAAAAAAQRGITDGRDWERYIMLGETRLDPFAATAAMQNTLAESLRADGLADAEYQYQLGVLPNAGGGTARLPTPCADARSWGWNEMPTLWIETHPAVAVCVQVDVPTTLLGRMIGQPVIVGVFVTERIR